MSLELLLQRIEEQRDELEVTALEAELNRTAPPRLVAALRAIDVPMVKVPQEVGGYQLNPLEQLRFYEALSYANPTAGWVSFVHGGAGGMIGAQLSDEGVKRVFGGAKPFCAAVAAPSGKAERVDGGWQVRGTWKWASGVQHSDWLILTAMAGSERPEPRMFVTPTDSVSYEDDWHVAALRGTGSIDVIADTFVAEEMSWSFRKEPQRGGAMYNMISIKSYVAPENAGFSLGVAQRALDEAAAYSATKSRGPGKGLLRDREVFRYELAKAALRVDASRALMIDVLNDVWASITAEDWNDVIDARVSAAFAHVTQETASAVTDIYHFLGASIIHQSNVLQRCLRDVHGATQHLYASNEAYEVHGLQLILGASGGEK